MEKKFNNTILIAPLDWGLGHATRCIPLIKHLLFRNCNVIIAASGPQEKLLKIEFPTLTFLPLKSYNIQYPSDKRWFSAKIVLQIPKILKVILQENAWLKKAVNSYKIDAVISDNRYGLWHKQKPSVFITHQLQLNTPALLEHFTRWMNYKFIEKFYRCWVPDHEGRTNLAGKLSHPEKLPAMPVSYLGSLSRFQYKAGVTIKYHLLIVISGPEPQRTLFEQKVLINLAMVEKPVLLVRGLPGSLESLPTIKNVTIVNHLPSEQLQQAFAESEFVISRSGYTTVMDIIALRKKSILVPTPGQTEQEYLADHLEKQNWCLSVRQDKFDLPAILQTALRWDYKLSEVDMEAYKAVLDDFLDDLKKR